MRKTTFSVALVGATLWSSTAMAHVTVQPSEAIAGAFSRFVVRVPTERPDAATTKVKVTLPPLAFVSFEPKEGWTRKIEMVELDEPIEAFGQEITETVGSVTWSGGSIEPGEFDEFGFSARMPD
ncbi:MAG TPA: YcnI family protein, partial [Actinomycetota bacterium]|nr:YcnI family protein [Actinomycetota bacterium]